MFFPSADLLSNTRCGMDKEPDADYNALGNVQKEMQRKGGAAPRVALVGVPEGMDLSVLRVPQDWTFVTPEKLLAKTGPAPLILFTSAPENWKAYATVLSSVFNLESLFSFQEIHLQGPAAAQWVSSLPPSQKAALHSDGQGGWILPKEQISKDASGMLEQQLQSTLLVLVQQ